MASKQKFYDLMKPYQMMKGTQLDLVRTHRGMQPTPISARFEGYYTDAAIREKLYNILEQLYKSKTQFAFVENIYHLADNALTRIRFDVDVNLSTSDRTAFSPHVDTFVDALYEYHTLSPRLMVSLFGQADTPLPYPMVTKVKNSFPGG